MSNNNLKQLNRACMDTLQEYAWELVPGKNPKQAVRLIIDGTPIATSTWSGGYESYKEDIMTILDAMRNNKSMASSKVEKAHARGNRYTQNMTYVKDQDMVDWYDNHDELRNMNQYNIDSLFFDDKFMDRYGIKLNKFIHKIGNMYITQHGLDLIKKIEKRDNVKLL